MERTTNLREMDAPGVASGKIAGDTVLAHTAVYPLPSEKEGNPLTEHLPEASPHKDLGGQNRGK